MVKEWEDPTLDDQQTTGGRRPPLPRGGPGGCLCRGSARPRIGSKEADL